MFFCFSLEPWDQGNRAFTDGPILEKRVEIQPYMCDVCLKKDNEKNIRLVMKNVMFDEKGLFVK